MAVYSYNSKMHTNPAATYSLDDYYFIVNGKELLIFKRRLKEGDIHARE